MTDCAARHGTDYTLGVRKVLGSPQFHACSNLYKRLRYLLLAYPVVLLNLPTDYDQHLESSSQVPATALAQVLAGFNPASHFSVRPSRNR